MKRHEIIKSFPALDLRRLLGRRPAADPLLGRERVRFYSSGRAALYHIVKSLDGGTRDTFLLPAYHCGVEVEAVLRAGKNVDFYRIKRNLGVDLEHLRSRIDSRTRGIVVAHYFGFPQEMAPLAELCRQRGIMLIEDCAHALYSQDAAGAWLGTGGDFALFSMRKTSFLPNGGAVLVNGSELPLPAQGKSYADFSLYKSTIKAVLEHEMSRQGGVARLCRLILDSYGRRGEQSVDSGPAAEIDDRRWYYDVPMYHYENDIARISLLLAGLDDIRSIIDRRRENYRRLAALLAARFRTQFVFPELPAGVCPLCFPLFVPQRDQVVAEMAARGVEPFVFGRLLHPLIADDQFPEAHYLADSIVGLPLHQQLGRQEMERVAAVFAEAATGDLPQ